eukprot:TRINITY_DN3802_c0_g1_i5.p1 TRINITY_DN3802_c0_g1~~TRINITY_DN3802_c0_g1_i5.p1  ORF type:complete len:654 (-),score=242.35 TRINITY_DN3802_c0_g1_i5:423-2384(-)
MKVYIETMESSVDKPPNKIYIKDFMLFAKRVAPDIYENNVKDAFYYLSKNAAMKLSGGFKEDSEEEKLYITSEELGRKYDEYVAKGENLKGVLSSRALRNLNYDLHLKVGAWKASLPNQKPVDEYYKKKTENILRKLDELSRATMLQKTEVDKATSDFYDLLERKSKLQWRYRTCMKFLATVPSSSVFSLKDLKRHLDNYRIQKLSQVSLLRYFSDLVKGRCAIEGGTFSFFDIPDLILTQKYGKNEYNRVIKFINKVKAAYLEEKRSQGKVQQIVETDLVPLKLLEETLAKLRYKEETKSECLSQLVEDSENEVEAKKAKLSITSERIASTIENNLFIRHLNAATDEMQTDLNLCLYIIKRLHTLVNSSAFTFRVNDFLPKFNSCMALTKADPEFKKANEVEMNKYGQKRKAPLDILSEQPESVSSRQPETVKPLKLVDQDVTEAIDLLNQPKKSAKEIIEPNVVDEFTPIIREPKTEEDKEQEESRFKTRSGKNYSPKRKFGILESEYVEYNPNMTKYEAVLPTEFYAKTINDQNPEKKEKWFLRPHHLETLTKHPYSKWDNILDTKYYSYYKLNEAEKVPSSKHEELERTISNAIECLEEQIDKLKGRAYLYEKAKTSRTPMEGFSLALSNKNDKSLFEKIERSLKEIKE